LNRVCNTLKRVGGGWAARNVDVDGFLDALDAHGVVVSGAVALVVGAGGAARAAGWALQRRGARVAVAARRNGEASAMAAELRAEIVSWPPHGIWDLLVNATPVGTWPGVDDTPVPDLTACRAAVVYDLVYNPAETRLLRDAAALGARVIGGLDMLVGQAARQFEWWTGRRPSPAVMRAAARAFVEETRTV
jgi:shikimate dehydrogenase